MLHYLLTLLVGGLVLNQSRLAIISPPLTELHGLSLAARIKFKSLMSAYKGRAGSAPSDWNNAVPAHAAPRQSRLFWTPRLFQALLKAFQSSKYQLASCNRSHLWPLFTLVSPTFVLPTASLHASRCVRPWAPNTFSSGFVTAPGGRRGSATGVKVPAL